MTIKNTTPAVKPSDPGSLQTTIEEATKLAHAAFGAEERIKAGKAMVEEGEKCLVEIRMVYSKLKPRLVGVLAPLEKA